MRSRPDIFWRGPDLKDMVAGMAMRSFLLVPVLLFPLVASAQTRADEHSGIMSQSASDTRKPLPLAAMMAEHQKQNMREHLAAVQAIIAAIGRDDMDGVAKASACIGYSEVMGQMCEYMGTAAPGFTTMTLNFHHTANTIGEAARRGDRYIPHIIRHHFLPYGIYGRKLSMPQMSSDHDLTLLSCTPPAGVS